MSKSKKVWIICGGQSPEHDISILSAENVTHFIDKSKYAVKPVLIMRSGMWHIPKVFFDDSSQKEQIVDIFQNYRYLSGGKSSEHSSNSITHSLDDISRQLLESDIDFVFIALHGKNGEDGVIQGFFETLKKKYTGSGVFASALAMNKVATQGLLSSAGIPVPKYLHFESCDVKPQQTMATLEAIEAKLGFPVVVKPAMLGSSIGVRIVHDISELENAIFEASELSNQIIVEKQISGMEVTCGVIEQRNSNGDRSLIALPPTEIVPKKREFFDYESKYDAMMTDEITPARLPPRTLAKIKRIALRVFKTIGCRGFSRVDMMVDDKNCFVIDVNTIPGLTETSLLPQGADALKISFPELLDIIAESAYFEKF